jgi:hypothetical protein
MAVIRRLIGAIRAERAGHRQRRVRLLAAGQPDQRRPRHGRVHLVEDASKETLTAAVEVMQRELSPAGLGLFYYAGHAVQYQGLNYLLPTDLTMARAKADLPGSPSRRAPRPGSRRTACTSSP